MSAVESRLAATLAKHGNRFRTFPDGPMSDRRWTGRCICGHVLECRTSMEPEPEGWLAEAHGRHVAAVITSADDLAVVELPVVAHKAVGVTDAEVFAGAAWRIEQGYAPGGSNTTAAVVELLRRVAKAAEGVSDRG